jgi:threonine aldolase
MDFRSDNVSGACPEVMAAVAEANIGAAAAYGDDEWTIRVQRAFADLFEREVVVWPVATGTAANALSLANVVPPYGALYAHAAAHIAVDECNAPEFFTGGAKVVAMPGVDGKIWAGDLETRLAHATPHGFHNAQPAAVSLSQATEVGTVYCIDELRAIGDLCRHYDVRFHVDGARIANAVVHLGCSFADATWRAGVDVLSFGATKNGAMAAEAVVFFDSALADRMPFLRKRAGHLFSKMRFLSAQLLAYVSDDVWRRNAARANATAARLVAGLEDLPGVALLHPLQANEIFIRLPKQVNEALRADGFLFHPWGDPQDGVVRLVTAFSTKDADVDRFVACARGAADSTRATGSA